MLRLFLLVAAFAGRVRLWLPGDGERREGGGREGGRYVLVVLLLSSALILPLPLQQPLRLRGRPPPATTTTTTTTTTITTTATTCPLWPKQTKPQDEISALQPSRNEFNTLENTGRYGEAMPNSTLRQCESNSGDQAAKTLAS